MASILLSQNGSPVFHSPLNPSVSKGVPQSFIHRYHLDCSIPLLWKGSPDFHSPLSPAPFNPFHKRVPLSFIHRYHLSHLIPFTKGSPVFYSPLLPAQLNPSIQRGSACQSLLLPAPFNCSISKNFSFTDRNGMHCSTQTQASPWVPSYGSSRSAGPQRCWKGRTPRPARCSASPGGTRWWPTWRSCLSLEDPAHTKQPSRQMARRWFVNCTVAISNLCHAIFRLLYMRNSDCDLVPARQPAQSCSRARDKEHRMAHW